MQTNEDTDELVIVEIDNIPTEEPEAVAEEVPEEAPEADEDDEEDDDEDARLGDSEDDTEDASSRNRNKRLKRRQAQKQARQKLETELRVMRDVNAELARKVNALEGVHQTQTESSLQSAYRAAEADVQQAERIIAKAVEAGNGDDVTAAMRFRDEARYRASQLSQEAERVTQTRQNSAPYVDPVTRSYAQQWMEANPWYNPQGNDTASVTARRIDQQLTAEKWNPASVGYFEELKRRLDVEFKPATPPPRKAPPMGTTREHAPPATRKNEVYVTPERRAALEELGHWEDKAVRDRYLRAYAEHDRKTRETR